MNAQNETVKPKEREEDQEEIVLTGLCWPWSQQKEKLRNRLTRMQSNEPSPPAKNTTP
jgi:hypothetical protein